MEPSADGLRKPRCALGVWSCIKTNVMGFSKAAAKVSDRASVRGGGLIHPLASEVNPRVDLLVEAEDLYFG
jgi:hypothetical protein